MTQHTGPATVAQLQDLHNLLAASMAKALRDAPSAELLSVARSFLRDQGLLGLAQEPKQRKRLERLYTLLLDCLLEALEGPGRPPAAVLSEVRQLLRSEGVTKDLGGAVDQARALKALQLADLPFKTPEAIQ